MTKKIVALILGFWLSAPFYAIGAAEVEPFDYGGEPMRYLENDRLKLGIDLSIGGAVTFLSDQENGGENMINSADWGRQIQLSFYSGPRPFIGPKGEKPTERWAGLGWNPIQSGDVGGNRSRVIHFSYPSENSMLLRCIPMQWPHDGVPGDCQFECLYTLEENVFWLKATIINDRWDKTQYDACSQEMPALYTNGPWYKLVSYLGDKPFANEPVTVIVDKNDGKGWPWVNFCTPEYWSALMDENGMGIGVYQKDAIRITAGFHGGDAGKGHGGVKGGQTGYIAPLTRQILDHNIIWSYETAFILGTIDDIRGFAEKQHVGLARPNWGFEKDRDSWYYQAGTRDPGWPISGELQPEFPAGGKMTGPETFWKSDENGILEIEAAFSQTGENNSPTALTVTIQPFGPSDMTDWLGWSEGKQDVEQERKVKADTFPDAPSLSTELPVLCDGVYRVYRLDLASLPDYEGAMKSVSLTFPFAGKAKIKRIGFAP